MRPDWDAYLRNHLPPAEMKEIAEALKRDEALQRDLDGFRRFRDQVRMAVLEEPVPAARLKTALGQVRAAGDAPKQRDRPPLRLALLVAAASVVVAALYVRNSFEHDPFNLARSPEVGVFSAKTEAEGLKWIRKDDAYRQLPSFSISGKDVKFSVARMGEDWACMDYILDGETMRVYIAPNPGAKEAERHGSGAQGVAWSKNGFSFALKGKLSARLVSISEQMIKG